MYTTNFKQETIKSEHSTNVQQQIEDHVRYINGIIQNGTFKSVLLSTRYKRPTKKVLKQTFGLHAMKKGTPLGGQEIYFTTDINTTGTLVTLDRGNVRLLGQFEENKCPQYKLIGVVDTHSRNGFPNLIDCEALRMRNTEKWLLKNYIKIKVTEGSSVRNIAVKKIVTR